MEKLFFAVPAASADTMHKTDGTHTNRPFFRSGQDERESIFFPEGHPPPAMSFVSFLQEKKSYPLLFFLEEKKQNKIDCG
ncbi:MAG: hypothetical protein SPI31_08585 [Eubacteriales bacterium]|nr:hypothetical protein [Eubacteriales bacterium]